MSYGVLDSKIDDYLGTKNLRPGPAKRLVNRIENIKSDVEKIKVSLLGNHFKLQKNINWDELVSVGKPNYFQEDTICVEFTSSKLMIYYFLDRICYIQATNDAAEFLFSTLLYKAYNLKIPECRIIEYKDPEYKIMLDALTFKTHQSQLRNLIEYDFREKPFILLYEYFPHITFLELLQARSKSLLTYRKSERSREIFINLGKIIAMDLIVNNPIRIPTILNHIGQPHLISLKMLKAYLLPTDNYKNPNFMNVFLDNYPIIPSNMKSNTLNPDDKYQLKQLSDYRNDFGDFLKQLFYEFRTITMYGVNVSTFEFKSLSRVKPFFLNVMGYDISSQNTFHLAMGIIILIEDFIFSDIEDLKRLISYVQKTAIYQDFGDTYYRSSFKLNIKYFEAIRETLMILHDQYTDIFEWCKSNTFGIYNLNPLNCKKKEEEKIKNNDNVLNNTSNVPKEENSINPNNQTNNTNNTNTNNNKKKLFSNRNVGSVNKDLINRYNEDEIQDDKEKINEKNQDIPKNVGNPFGTKKNTNNTDDKQEKDSVINSNLKNTNNSINNKSLTDNKNLSNLKYDNNDKTNSSKNNLDHKIQNNSSDNSLTDLLFKTSLDNVLNRYDELRYVPILNKINTITEDNSNKDNKKEIKKLDHHDHFNINKNDIVKYKNDVHNGIYDVVDIDMELKNFVIEWKDRKLHDGIDTNVPILDLKSDEIPPDVKKKQITNNKIDAYDHKRYTKDELKELVIKKELKDTLNIKEELNPDEANNMKAKFKNVDPELLEGKEYAGNKLGKSYEINKKLDQDLDRKLKKIEDDKLEASKLNEINLQKQKNEKQRKEKEENDNINELEHVDTIKTEKENKKSFFKKK